MDKAQVKGLNFDLFDGLLIPIYGLRLLFSSLRVFFWAILPVPMMLACFIFGVRHIWKSDYLLRLVDHYFKIPDELLFGISTDTTIIWVTNLLMIMVFSYLLFIVFLTIAAPFFSMAVESHFHKENVIPDRSFLKQFQFSMKMLWVGLCRTLLFVIMTVIFFLIGWALGMPIISLAFSSWALAFDVFDYSLEMFGFKLNERLDFARMNLGAYLALGFVLSVNFWIPFMLFLLYPLCIIGVAKLITHKNKKKAVL